MESEPDRTGRRRSVCNYLAANRAVRTSTVATFVCVYMYISMYAGDMQNPYIISVSLPPPARLSKRRTDVMCSLLIGCGWLGQARPGQARPVPPPSRFVSCRIVSLTASRSRHTTIYLSSALRRHHMQRKKQGEYVGRGIKKTPSPPAQTEQMPTRRR